MRLTSLVEPMRGALLNRHSDDLGLLQRAPTICNLGCLADVWLGGRRLARLIQGQSVVCLSRIDEGLSSTGSKSRSVDVVECSETGRSGARCDGTVHHRPSHPDLGSGEQRGGGVDAITDDACDHPGSNRAA